MDPALVAMLTDTLLVAPLTGRDAYGAPSYGPQVSVKGRVEKSLVTQFTPQGRQVVQETRISMDGTAPVTEGSQLTLPDSTVHLVQKFAVVEDEQGNIDHFEVVL